MLYKNVVINKSLLRCKNCGVWILHPFPHDKEREKIYQDDYYARWEYNTETAEEIKLIKKRLYSNIIREIESYISVHTILDIGCAMGFSLEVAKEKGLVPYGVEISDFAGKIAIKKFGDAVKVGDIKDIDFKEDYFDAITMVDLFEHIDNPKPILVKLRRILKSNGVLAIIVPDTSSFSSKIMRRHWPHIKNEHLYYYSREAITTVLSQINFKIEAVSSFPKPTTFSYAKSVSRCSGSQFLYYILSFLCAILPRSLKTININLPMGEMLVIARKGKDGKHS